MVRRKAFSGVLWSNGECVKGSGADPYVPPFPFPMWVCTMRPLEFSVRGHETLGPLVGRARRDLAQGLCRLGRQRGRAFATGLCFLQTEPKRRVPSGRQLRAQPHHQGFDHLRGNHEDPLVSDDRKDMVSQAAAAGVDVGAPNLSLSPSPLAQDVGAFVLTHEVSASPLVRPVDVPWCVCLHGIEEILLFRAF